MRGLATGIRSVLLLGLVLAGSGCVGARGYFTDRWADAKDVFTASVGTGGGAKVRVGPIQVGAFYNSDIGGLRAGTSFWINKSFGEREFASSDMTTPIPVPREIGHGTCALFTSMEDFFPWAPRLGASCDRTAAGRDKDYSASSLLYVPFLTIPSRAPYYYTQLEVAAGLGGTLRLGFNPGELLDFLLGWTNLDIYGDDLEARKEREEAKKAKEPPPTPSTPIPTPTPTEGPDGTR